MKVLKTGQVFNVAENIASISNKELTWNDKLVLAKVLNKYSFNCYINWYKNKEYRMSISYISIGTNISLASVQRSIKKLIRLGYIRFDGLNYYPTEISINDFTGGIQYEEDDWENDSGGMGWGEYTIMKLLKGYNSSESFVFSWIYGLIDSGKKHRRFTYKRLCAETGLENKYLRKIINKLLDGGFIELSYIIESKEKVFYLEKVNTKRVIENIYMPKPKEKTRTLINNLDGTLDADAGTNGYYEGTNDVFEGTNESFGGTFDADVGTNGNNEIINEITDKITNEIDIRSEKSPDFQRKSGEKTNKYRFKMVNIFDTDSDDVSDSECA